MSEMKEKEKDEGIKPGILYKRKKDKEDKWAVPEIHIPENFETYSKTEIYAVGRNHGKSETIDMLKFAERYASLKRTFWAAIVIDNIVLVGIIIYFAIQFALLPFYWVPREIPLI